MALVGSLLIHVVTVALLALWIRPEGPTGPPGPRREIIIQVRLAPPDPPKKKKKVKPPERQQPEKQPPKQPRAEPAPDRRKTEAPRAEELVAKTAPPPTPLQPFDATRLRSFPDAPPLGHGGGMPTVRVESPSGAVGGLGARGEGKIEALGRYGGSGETEDAVARGLRWLAAHQDADGGWSARDYQRHCRHHVVCAGRGLEDFDVGVTALATLAFLGAGYAPHDSAYAGGSRASGPFHRNVEKALEYLIDHQNGAGVFGARGDKYFYDHALASLAVCEAWAMSGRAAYRESAVAALRFSVAGQQPGGGWDYTSEKSGRNDLSVTGWQLMALRSARRTGGGPGGIGLPVPPSVEQNARHFLARAFTSDGYGIYANKEPEPGRRGVNMVAVGLLSHLYLGGMPRERRARLAARRILYDHPPDVRALGDWPRTFQSYYYWYTATLSLFHIGGQDWDAWNTLLKRVLLPLQSRQTHREGSWDPEPSWIGKSGGRVYSTAINVLTLEVYYRYTPLFATRRS